MSRRGALVIGSLTTLGLLSVSLIWTMSSTFVSIGQQCSTVTESNGQTAAANNTGVKELEEVKWSDVVRSNLSLEKLYEEDDEEENDRYWAHVAANKARIDVNLRSEMRLLEFNRTTVDRIYYINLPHRSARRTMMEEWLQQQPVPFQRIVPVRGTGNVMNCIEAKRGAPGTQCRAISSLSRTVVGIARDKNVTGLTLVLEDDFKLNTTIDKLLEESFRLVPLDWDIIRWNCWGFLEKLIEQWHTEKAIVSRTIKSTFCELYADCYYSGGTHAMLWRGSSIDKLINIWAEVPYADIDFRLTTPRLKSYCINFYEPPGGFMHSDLPEDERSDVP